MFLQIRFNIFYYTWTNLIHFKYSWINLNYSSLFFLLYKVKNQNLLIQKLII